MPLLTAKLGPINTGALVGTLPDAIHTSPLMLGSEVVMALLNHSGVFEKEGSKELRREEGKEGVSTWLKISLSHLKTPCPL